MPRWHLSLAALAVAAITGCTSAAQPPSIPQATSAATSASVPAGCTQATAAVTAAQEQINAQDFSGAATRIADLRDTLPRGKLQVDAALAAPKIAFLNLDATQGNPVLQDIKDVQGALDVISADCAP